MTIKEQAYAIINGFTETQLRGFIDLFSKYQPESHTPVYHVVAVVPHEDYTLTVTFRDGDKKLYDMRPLIDGERAFKPYAPLIDINLFMKAHVCGSVAWSDKIDIAPEELYENGIDITEKP